MRKTKRQHATFSLRHGEHPAAYRHLTKRRASVALLQKSIQLLGKPLPKVITPKAHMVADYAIAALFLIGAALFWKRNKRAAIASLVCGTAEAGVAAITTVPAASSAASASLCAGKLIWGFRRWLPPCPSLWRLRMREKRTSFVCSRLPLWASRLLPGLTRHTQRIRGRIRNGRRHEPQLYAACRTCVRSSSTLIQPGSSTIEPTITLHGRARSISRTTTLMSYNELREWARSVANR